MIYEVETTEWLPQKHKDIKLYKFHPLYPRSRKLSGGDRKITGLKHSSTRLKTCANKVGQVIASEVERRSKAIYKDCFSRSR